MANIIPFPLSRRQRLESFSVDGCPAFLLLPPVSAVASPLPWLWFAPTFKGLLPDAAHVWLFNRLLKSGIAIAGIDVGESHGSPLGRRQFSRFYDRLVRHHGLSARPGLLAQSRGGLMHYNWAADNPGRTACIAGIYPVCDLLSFPGLEIAARTYGIDTMRLAARLHEHNPIERLEPLARWNVPILHVHGDADTAVPLGPNSEELQRRYRLLGGTMQLHIAAGRNHEIIPEFFQFRPLLDFLTDSLLPP